MLQTLRVGRPARGHGVGGDGRAYAIPAEYPRGKYLLVFDPLDGSSNIDVNVSVGSDLLGAARDRTASADPMHGGFPAAGRAQVAAGYALYGPTTMLVLTVGNGVHGFTLDREIGDFMLTHPDMRIPERHREFAINASNERFWEPPVQRYVDECLAGQAGPRGATSTCAGSPRWWPRCTAS